MLCFGKTVPWHNISAGLPTWEVLKARGALRAHFEGASTTRQKERISSLPFLSGARHAWTDSNFRGILHEVLFL